MTQKEFDWNGLSLLSQVDRMVCNESEREILLALIRIYRRMAENNPDKCIYEKGHILMIVSKRQLADEIGRCSTRTVQRKLQNMAEEPSYCRFFVDGPGKPNFFDIDVSRILDAQIDSRRASIPEQLPDVPVTSLRDLQRQLEQQKKPLPLVSKRGETKIIRPETPETCPGTPETCPGSTRDKNPRHPGQKPETPETPRTVFTPYHKTIKDHCNPDVNQTIKTMNDGSLSRISFQDLQEREFRDPAAIQSRYQEVVQAGIAKDCESDRLAFFALMIHIARQKKLKNPAGLLTQLLRGEIKSFGKTWRLRATNKDCDQALKMIKKLDFGPSDYKRESDLLTDSEWVDESEFTDEVPLIAEAEQSPDLPPDDMAQLREVYARKQKELVKA